MYVAVLFLYSTYTKNQYLIHIKQVQGIKQIMSYEKKENPETQCLEMVTYFLFYLFIDVTDGECLFPANSYFIHNTNVFVLPYEKPFNNIMCDIHVQVYTCTVF